MPTGSEGLRVPLVRSITFRTAMVFWLLFAACFAVAALIFYETLQARLLSRIDTSITERLGAIEREFERSGIVPVVALGQRRAELPMQNSMGFHLSDASGVRIAGNVPLRPAEPGWAILAGERLGLDGDEGRYRFHTSLLGDYRLSIGRSLYALEDLRSVAFQCLLWAFAASVLLAVLASAFIARRVHRRIDGLRHALERVSCGDLDVRLPTTCAADDIDAMSVTINEALARLSRTVEGMRQVSTDIAHDLKTPLNRLAIQLDEAAGASRAGRCVGAELDQALEETRGISATFEALLRIAQIEAGARRASFATLDLTPLLANLAEVYEVVAEESGQRLELELPDAVLTVQGDRELLVQLVVNLLENAIHHAGRGARIRLAAGREGRRVRFAVSDDGPGVPPPERERVFQRLYRLERSRTSPGTGLGLSLVKAIADLHCARVALADTETGTGLRVEVVFDGPRPIEV